MVKNIIIMIAVCCCMMLGAFASTTKKHHAHHARIVSKKIVAQKKIKRLYASKVTRNTQLSKVNTNNLQHSLIPAYLLTSIQKNLVNFVKNTMESIHYTTYKLGGTRIEPSRGIYIVDCSSYVDHILKTVYPRSYSSLAIWSGTQKPTTNDFYHYFRNLTDNSRHWNTIEDAEELSPGDILVFRNKNRMGAETGGHVMVVMDKP